MIFLKRHLKVNNISNRLKVLIPVLCFLNFIYFYLCPATLSIDFVGSIPDIQEDVQSTPSKGKSIFFIESSKKKGIDTVVSLTIRQACAVESAAKLNPETTVYVLFTLPLLYPNWNQCAHSNCTIIRDLLMYRNIKMRSVNMVKYFKGTPLEEWMEKGQLWKSNYLVEHTSDVMRLLTLWKFGGTYLDLDVVVLKSFEDLAPNFAGRESENDIANGVMNFDHANFGHELIERYLREIHNNFRGDLWSHNGPEMLKKVLTEACNASRISDMTVEACNGFQLFPETVFYPIHYSIFQWFFLPDKVDAVLERIKDSHALHLWNKLSYAERIPHPNETSVAYTRVAEIKCPHTFRKM